MRVKEDIDKKAVNGYLQGVVASLKHDFPVLSQAINLLKFKLIEGNDSENTTFYDGEYVYLNSKAPSRFEGMYYNEHIKRDILHIVFHGLLGHFSIYDKYQSKKLTDVTMDRIVEHMVTKIIPDEHVFYIEKEMNKYLGESFDMSCYYKGRRKLDVGKKMVFWGSQLKRDDHSKWTKMKENIEGGNFIVQEWAKVRKTICKFLNVSDMQEKDFTDKLINTLKVSKDYGACAGDCEEIVKASEGEGESYREIILKHLTTKNKDREEPDTIDNMMYQYGLEMYGDVPLIEPIDENEIVSLNTLCIAVDVSGSCRYEIASVFLRETKKMFQELKQVCSGGEVYYWECDTELQKEEYYESVEEISDEDWECRELRGFGGTSFIPVFERIDSLITEGKEIDCLIYLTDGDGSYPSEEPEYPVYFILSPDSYIDKTIIPDWVKCIEIKE